MQSFTTEFDKAPKRVMAFERRVTRENVEAAFERMAGHQIPSLEDFVWALGEATALLARQPNLVSLSPRPGDRVIFVGDMHGCFETLIRLFAGHQEARVEPLGFPGHNQRTGRRNVYIFNGDLVDRGGSGYQVVFLLALLVLLDPQTTRINRGNHESEMFGASTQPGMGHKFLFEVQEKFPGVDMAAYSGAVAAFFYALPLGVRLDRNVLVVHGGVPVAAEPVARPPAPPFEAQPAQRPQGVAPYDLGALETLVPPRQQTANLEDQPAQKNLLWHQFLWSYDRQPYAADFMEHNGIKTIVCSHTATPYHFVTTFLPVEAGAESYGIQSVARGDDTFHKVRDFFAEHPNLARVKLSMVEVFSSPTNQGQMYAAYVDAVEGPEGERLCYDPLNWHYHLLGAASEFRFVSDQAQ